jgi:Trk-type K+ transport system membrane component
MNIKQFHTDAQHNAYTYRHIKAQQHRSEIIRDILAVIVLAVFAVLFAQLFIGLD